MNEFKNDLTNLKLTSSEIFALLDLNGDMEIS